MSTIKRFYSIPSYTFLLGLCVGVASLTGGLVLYAAVVLAGFPVLAALFTGTAHGAGTTTAPAVSD